MGIRHERCCNSVVLIINCLSLLFCDSGRPERLRFFQKQEAEGNLYFGEGLAHRVLLSQFCTYVRMYVYMHYGVKILRISWRHLLIYMRWQRG